MCGVGYVLYDCVKEREGHVFMHAWGGWPEGLLMRLWQRDLSWLMMPCPLLLHVRRAPISLVKSSNRH